MQTTGAWVRNAWFDSGYIFCRQFKEGFQDEFSYIYVKVELWILRSILVSLCKHGEEEVARSSSTMAVACISWFAGEDATSRCVPGDCRWVGLHTGEVCTVDASVAVSLGNSDIFL